MNEDGIVSGVESEYPDYLRDESRRAGRADSISFPLTEEALRRQLEAVRRRGLPVTTQAARTGITGGAVPEGGHVLNLSGMNRLLGLRRDPVHGHYLLTAQPGVRLAELREAVAAGAFPTEEWTPASARAAAEFSASGAFFFPPDPTESSAALGGMAACNASGARSYFYGPTRRYVERLRVVLADGDVLELARGEQKARGRAFEVTTAGGRRIRGKAPAYRMPAVKNAAGYYAEDDMDVVDLFIGSEGTLGVLTEIDLRLIPAPAVVWGVAAFLPSEEAALAFVRKLRGGRPASARAAPGDVPGAEPVAIEFFDSRALELLRSQKRENPAFKALADLPAAWHTGVYVEYHGDLEEQVEEAVARMSEWMADCGGDLESAWLACDDNELKRLKDFRHAVPEAVNLLIDERRRREPFLTKLGTDLAVPDEGLEAVMALYHADLAAAGLEYVVFGHVGDNHVHVNIIPGSLDDYRRGKELYLKWAGEVVAMGGTVSAEHGIGKLKTDLLRTLYGEDGIGEMIRVKGLFDPEGLLNRGNLFV